MTATPAEVIEHALAAIARYGRPDLDARLRHAARRVADDRVRVLVVGEFKQGKSMLVNGLVAAPVCPVADDIATAVPTVVRHADTVTVTLVRRTGDAGPSGEPVTERVEVPAEELGEHVTESGDPRRRRDLVQVEVAVPRPLLAGGLEIVDTPGVGGLSSVHGAATTAALPTADAVLLVSDASQEYTRPEMDFLAGAAAVCPNVACVLTKVDLYPEWRRIAELDAAHLTRAGITARTFAVSSSLRWEAVLTGDTELNEESGFPELVGFLRRDVVAQADRLARRGIVHDVRAVTDQIAGSLRAEYTAQQNPETAGALMKQLTAAREHATQLKERSARWQQTLGDGIADLNADIDHDLRGRMREITRAADEELSAGDPAKTWDQLCAWVYEEVAAAASTNFLWATQRTRWLAERVAEHFSGERDRVLPALRSDPSDVLRGVRPLTLQADEPWTLGQKVLTGFRGSYGGMVMFGMLSALVGLGTINPISVGAGLALGGRAVVDERKRIVAKRQNAARAAVKRYVDDVTFQVGKDSRDRLRGVQRDLRDHFTGQAEELKTSLQGSLQAAEKAVKASAEQRAKRLPEIKAELESLDVVRREARALLTPAPAATAPEPVEAGAG